VGTFPGGTILQFIACGLDQEIPVCFTARTRRLGGSESEGHVRFGAEMSASEDFDDFFFDVFLTPAPAQDTLAVELTLAPDSLGPVLAPLFDAVTQVAEISAGHRAGRADTVRVRLRAWFSPSGVPAAGAAVRLVPSPVSGSGGHAHDPFDRPVGTFFPVGADLDVPEGGVRGQLRLTLPESGDTVLLYRTSGLSGLERLGGNVTAGGFSKGVTDTVTVRWPGLVAMERLGTTYEFLDQNPDSATQRHGNTNHWVEPTFRARALDAFQRYFAAVPEPRFPLPNPGGGTDTRVVITEASLEWGGLLDVASDGPWHYPHKGHRKGRDMDVRSRTLDTEGTRRFLKYCRDAGLDCTPEPNEREPHSAPHFHLRNP
jgi:hypothetical protein